MLDPLKSNTATIPVLARATTRERLLLLLTAAVTAITIPAACFAAARQNYTTAVFLAGAPLLPVIRSAEILARVSRLSRSLG